MWMLPLLFHALPLYPSYKESVLQRGARREKGEGCMHVHGMYATRTCTYMDLCAPSKWVTVSIDGTSMDMEKLSGSYHHEKQTGLNYLQLFTHKSSVKLKAVFCL